MSEQQDLQKPHQSEPIFAKEGLTKQKKLKVKHN